MNARIEELRVAIAIAERAGRELARMFDRDLEVEHKSSAIDLVTAADRASEAIVIAGLREAFADDGILAEESGAVASGGRTWIVDPLDGTTNYAHHFPHFSVSIALYQGDEPLLGVVHDPLRGETFSAAAGAGAWLDSPRHEHVRLAVSRRASLAASLLATGFPYDPGRARSNNLAEFAAILPRVHGIRRPGSAALDLAYVAAARIDGYWEHALAPWDWAAGVLLVREAGGVIAAIADEPWSLHTSGVVAAGPALHPELLTAVRDAVPR